MWGPIVACPREGLGNQLGCVLAALQFGAAVAPQREVHVLDRKTNVSTHGGSHAEDVFAFWPGVPRMSVADMQAHRLHTRSQSMLMQKRLRDAPRSDAAIRFRSTVAHMQTTDFGGAEALIARQGALPAPRLPLRELVNEEAFNVRDALFMHVRRGDYTSTWICRTRFALDLHARYYPLALQSFAEPLRRGARVLVCSDDIEWCREVLPRQYAEAVPQEAWCFTSAACGAHDTLSLMAQCGLGGILANSSLSWCGAMWGRSLGETYGQPRERRMYVGPSNFMRAPWPMTSAMSRRALPPWCAHIGVLNARGTQSTSYEYVGAAALFAACILALALARRQARRGQSSR